MAAFASIHFTLLRYIKHVIHRIAHYIRTAYSIPFYLCIAGRMYRLHFANQSTYLLTCSNDKICSVCLAGWLALLDHLMFQTSVRIQCSASPIQLNPALGHQTRSSPVLRL